jgi:FKBP-type peptidyl-prolyl cis-trans isomerase
MKYQKGNIIVAVIFIVVIFIVGYSLYVYSNKDKNLESNLLDNQNQIENTQEQEKEEEKEETVNLENEMEKTAKNGDILVMNYTGRFVDGKVFDSNVLAEFGHVEPFKFKLGAGQVIKGWDEGLLGMKIGEKKTLTIPPEKAYGPNDYHSIPGNSTLIFDVELIGIE